MAGSQLGPRTMGISLRTLYRWQPQFIGTGSIYLHVAVFE